MMKVFWVLGLAALIVAVTSFAQAGGKCPRGYSTDACEAWLRAQSRPPYAGALAPTTEAMVCLFAAQREPSALTLYVGTNERRGAVITTFRNQGWQRGPGYYLKEVCFPRRQIKGHTQLVLCGSVGYSEWNAGDIRSLLARGRIGPDDPAQMWTGGT